MSGTPTVAGEYTIKVSAWSEGCVKAATAEFTLTVEADSTENPPIIDDPDKPVEEKPGSGCAGCGSTIDAGFGLIAGLALISVVTVVITKKSRDK